jgi:predicted Rossmann-fold nucleotide-binding protein
MKSICIFCGAFAGNDPIYREAAHALGAQLARRSIELVWGGGGIGLMGAIADAVLASGGQTYGAASTSIFSLPRLTRMRCSMHWMHIGRRKGRLAVSGASLTVYRP